MKINKIKFLIIILCFLFFGTHISQAEPTNYPDYATEFLGEDIHEKYNRKMFNFNRKLNKYVIKPVHIIWASIMPQYGMDRILGITNNIEFPVRFFSSVIQKDFKNAGRESARFIVNTTIGVGGMFDPARHILKIEQSSENMEQAIAKYHPQAKHYFIFPVIYFTTYRGLAGRVLDMALTPTTYIGNPFLAAVKAVLTINRTSYYQSLIKLLETGYADPYEVYKTAYGIDSYIKMKNYDRQDVISQLNTNNTKKKNYKTELKVSAVIADDIEQEDINNNYNQTDKKRVKTKRIKKKRKNKAEETYTGKSNITFTDYNPQDPFTDSMRTMLFYLPSSEKSFWNEMSLWNRSFKNKIKSSDINLAEGRKNYTYRYILQKDKTAPLAVVYPSTGDGVTANHPAMFAKLFYDEGYSVLIIGNPYQWEFTNSMPEGYRPGLPENDAKMLRMTTAKIIGRLEEKYNRKFENKVILGTSYGAATALFMAQQESKENTLGNVKFIAICPPINLYYAVSVIDKTCQNIANSTRELKDIAASAAAKAVKLYKYKKDIKFEVNNMPFTEKESRFLTCLLMHQKLSDVIYVIEDSKDNEKEAVYKKINNLGYKEYSEKYLGINTNKANKRIMESTKLTYISDYLKTADNYKIYHTTNDYLINSAQLKQLQKMAGKKLVIIENGSHMGFLYRPEFLQDLNYTIKVDKEN